MRHILPFEDTQFFNVANPVYVNLILEESKLLNEAESLIPDNILFELELNMILNGGRTAVTAYHRDIVNGTNHLIKEASSHLSKSQMNNITESYKLIANKIQSLKLNEDESLQLEIDKDANDVMANIESNKDASGVGEGDGGIFNMVKNLFYSLTESGTPIGILHLILDIVGVIGDVFGPVGFIADMLNGIIYMARGKTILALISFIAAIIPFGGDIIKGMFKGTKVGAEVMGAAATMTTKYTKETGAVVKGTTKVSDEAASLLAKASPESIETLTYISKSTKTVIPGVRGFIHKFFNDFLAKVVGWLPIIGKPLKKFFQSIASLFDNFEKQALKLADDIPLTIEKSQVKSIDEFFEASSKRGTKIINKGDTLIIQDAGGRTLKELPANLLKGTDMLKSRYGSVMTGEIDQFIKRTQGNVADFYESLALNIKYAEKTYGAVNKIGKLSLVIKKGMPLFIGKQIVKFVGMVNKQDNLSDSEYKSIGFSTIQQAVQNLIKRTLEKDKNVKYVVPIIDAIKEPEAAEAINGTLNTYASQFNLPEIGIAVYASQRRKDEMPEDVRKFYETVYADKKKQIEELENQGLFGSSSVSKMYEDSKYVHSFKSFITMK